MWYYGGKGGVLKYLFETEKKSDIPLWKNDKNHKLITERDKVKPFVEKFTYNSEKLKTILNNQQVVFDKIGLGFRRIFK